MLLLFYSGKDNEAASHIHDYLEKRNIERIDVVDRGFFVNHINRPALSEYFDKCDTVVFVISKIFCRSKLFIRGLRTAHFKKQNIIFFLVNQTSFSPDVEKLTAGVHQIPAYAGYSFDRALLYLQRAIEDYCWVQRKESISQYKGENIIFRELAQCIVCVAKEPTRENIAEAVRHYISASRAVKGLTSTDDFIFVFDELSEIASLKGPWFIYLRSIDSLTYRYISLHIKGKKTKWVRCPICGMEFQFDAINDSEKADDYDLDFRRVGAYRHNYYRFVCNCDNCGYILDWHDSSYDYTAIVKERVTRNWLELPVYQKCDDVRFINDTLNVGEEKPYLIYGSRMLYRRHLISLQCDKVYLAIHDLLHAAWECEDAEDRNGAIICRKKAVDMCENLLDNIDAQKRIRLILLEIDMLRRLGKFEILQQKMPTLKDNVRELYPLLKNKLFETGFNGVFLDYKHLEAILEFQMVLAEKKDMGCHSVNEVF